MFHPTPLPKEPGGRSKKVSWFRAVWRSIRERSIIAGTGIHIDYTLDGARVSLARQRRVSGGTGGTGAIVKATVRADPMENDDKLKVTIDGSSTEIALPYLLRKTPFDGNTRNGVTYEYLNNGLRDAELQADSYTERQTIVPLYVQNDIVYCQDIGEGVTGVTGADYIDLNLDGRAWALVASDI